MNFPQFINIAVYHFGGQYLVQGRRSFITRNGRPAAYPPETFLTTSDRERAHEKERLLIAATAHI